jgi:hypothetical protein
MRDVTMVACDVSATRALSQLRDAVFRSRTKALPPMGVSAFLSQVPLCVADRAHLGFDALVVIDADTVADPLLLAAFDDALAAGHEVQQAYNYLSNPWESSFTR